MEAANASIKEVHRVGMNLQLAFNTVLRDPSEELSNTATSSTTDLTIDEESSSEQGELIRKNKYQRTRKSAELARRKIIQDKKGRFTYVKTSSLSEFTRENSCDKNICKFDAKCSLGISLNCGDCTNTNHYHISRLEHVCQQCYEEFKMGKPLFGRYMDWKQHWIEESRCVPFLRMFIFEEFLPYWLSCSDCGKFRQISRSKDSTLSPTILSMFKCAHAFPPGLDDPCSLPEEKEVSEVRSAPSLYIKSLGAPPLLQHSPAIYFLEDHYFYDEVGISPVNAQMRHEAKKDFMFPFNIPNEASKAFSLRPDILEHDEICAFPEFAKDQILYLAIRNLVVALWNLNPYEYLDYEKCLSYLICPGLARVWYSIELKRVLDYLILKNVINYGVLPIPKDTLLGRKNAQKLEVVVVGGGISGIGAARQLRYLGANVVLLEAKSKLGGRMQDDWSLGVAVGCGAQLVTGIINNPIILMCEQIELPYRLLSDDCPLIDAKSGRLVTPVSDRVVDEHFNCLLDIIGHWKNEENVKDVDLLCKQFNMITKLFLAQIHDLHEKLLKHIDFKWAKEFDRLLQWQIGNVEFSCGALLSEVSAKHWDQNEDVGQFAGAHALLSHGSGELIKRLAEGIDVRCGHHVVDIDYTNAKKIVVKCGNGKRYTCDKVLLCLPLTQYQKRQIKFQPELPLEKLMASHALGCGLIEKVAVRFPHRFWSSLLKSDGTIDYFGHVPKTDKGRGLFNMFYDFSTRGTARKQQQYVLMSYICGESVQLVNEKTDLEVVEEFLNILQELFPKENIPAPTGYVVTHWGKDPHIGMSYSFMRLGASGNDYDEMSRSVDNRLYFAGECTSRFFPQTMTGAYVSALRESSKIVEDWLKFN